MPEFVKAKYNANKYKQELVDSKSAPLSNLKYEGSRTYADNSTIKSNMQDDSDILMNHAIVDRFDVDWHNRFSRFGFVDPFNSIRRTKEYIFFTKPDLHLYNTNSPYKPNIELYDKSPFFHEALDRYKEVAMQLQFGINEGQLPFIPILSNAVNSSLDLPGISADTIETSRNVYGFQIPYRGTSSSSDSNFDFTLEFKDNRFLETYMLFKIYDEYERMKWLGQVTPPSKRYIENRVLHDQMAVYKIITAEDGMTILYFARGVGVIPLSVPRDSMSNLESDFTFSVSFKAAYIYDMDPRILVDFNRLTANFRKNKRKMELFDSDSKTINGNWASCPYILTRVGDDSRRDRYNKYYLAWTK